MPRGRLSGHPLHILCSIQPFLGNKEKVFPHPANLAEKKILIIPLESKEYQQKISFLSLQNEVTPFKGLHYGRRRNEYDTLFLYKQPVFLARVSKFIQLLSKNFENHLALLNITLAK